MGNFLNIVEIISPIITIFISTAISCIVAKIQTRHEIKKTLMAFAHEDKQALETAFSDLLTKTGELSNSRSTASINEALHTCSIFISLCPENFHQLLIDLDKAIRRYEMKDIEILRVKLIQLYSKSK